MVKTLKDWGVVRKLRSIGVQYSGNSMCMMVETASRRILQMAELKGSQVCWAIREAQGRDGTGGYWQADSTIV